MKALIGFTIILLWSFLIPASGFSGGFFFDREKFVEDTTLHPDDSRKDFLPAQTLSGKSLAAFEDDFTKRYILRLYRMEPSAAAGKKANASDVGISVSQTSRFFNLRGMPNVSSDDQMISSILRTLPSLLEKDAQGQSLEKLGKILEPQVNIYFEF